ncbi:MAG: hypothetical protein N2560_02470 [Ignavibacteria bacterium]|nr:hypothetical protein [Ignavibacteria bacterium]
MKSYITFFFLLISSLYLNSQIFYTVVSPNGSTKVDPTPDSALLLANNNDIIYSPAGNFNDDIRVKKLVHIIIGAGYNYTLGGSISIST